MAEAKNKGKLIAEFKIPVEALYLVAFISILCAIGIVAGVSTSALFVGAAFFSFAYMEAKKWKLGHFKKEVMDELDNAIEMRNEKFKKEAKAVLFNEFLVREVYCDIQGPRSEGHFLVVGQLSAPGGNNFTYLYKHADVNGKDTSADELIEMEQVALGEFSTLLVEQGLDATSVMDAIEYRVKDKIESRKAARGAKPEDGDNGDTEPTS